MHLAFYQQFFCKQPRTTLRRGTNKDGNGEVGGCKEMRDVGNTLCFVLIKGEGMDKGENGMKL